MNRSNRHLGFTLTEMLVVIGIITVVAIMAMPVFRAMTGTRSTEAAQNQLSGALARARAEAIGLQAMRGVMFIRDPATQRVQAVMVQEAQRPTVIPATVTIVPDVFLDLVPDRDPVLLPEGVGFQMIDDCELSAGAGTPDPLDDVRKNDAYIGFNVQSNLNDLTPGFTFGGVILFDGYGRVVNRSYAFKFFKEVPGAARQYSELAKFLDVHRGVASVVDFYPPTTLTPARLLKSQFGFVVYDQTVFADQGFNDGDPQLYTSAGAYIDHKNDESARSAEAKEERWIDANAVPVLVSRSNGTLVKGE